MDFIKFLIVLLLFNLSSNTASAQDISSSNQKAQLTSVKIKKKDSSYKVKYFDRIIIKTNFSSETPNFIFTENQTGSEIEIKPVAEYKQGLSFIYRWFTLALSFTPKYLINDKDIEALKNSETFGLDINVILSERWRQELGYTYYEGFFNSGNSLIEEGEFANTTLEMFQGSTVFTINRNFSYRAHLDQTERQLKSAGSLIPRLSYDFSKSSLNFSDFNLDNNVDKINSINVYAQIGYLYTFVHNEKWFATIGGHPGLGYNYSRAEYITGTAGRETSRKENFHNLSLALEAETSLGYNSDRWFFGTAFNWRNYQYSNNQNDVLISNDNYFNIYLGYRLNGNAPMRKFFGWFEEKLGLDVD